MSIIKSVIWDEYERNKRMQEAYQKELEDLPRGSISKKSVKGNQYYYLVYRQGGKVINKYLSQKAEDIEKLRALLARRKHLELLLNNLKSEQSEMERYLRRSRDG